MLVKTFVLGDVSILCQLEPRQYADCVDDCIEAKLRMGSQKRKGKHRSDSNTLVHSNIGSYTTRNAQLKIIHNRIRNDWSPYILFLVKRPRRKVDVRQRW